MLKKLLLYTSILLTIACSEAPKQITVAIQPYENIENYISDSIAASLKRVYNFNTILIKNKKLPNTSFINLKKPRFRADSLLIDLKNTKPDSINYILGLTKKDISTTKKNKDGSIKKPAYKYKDWGVFGLGYCPGPSCIVSSYRYKTTKKALFINRIQKICVHEVGHNLGLPHCKSGLDRVMQDAAETIKTIDNVKMSICESCKKKLKTLSK